MSLTFDEFDDTNLREDVEKYWNTTSSIIFLIDVTKGMNQNDHLLSCLQMYRNVVKQKCYNNKKDKMGLVLFGTKETNCRAENVMILQEFETVTIDSLKNIQAILQDEMVTTKYETVDSCSLYDALLNVFQTLHASKSNARPYGTILLCTHLSNPNLDNLERQRIEKLVTAFKDTQTKLLVAGLSDQWNDENFYKDLQIISGTFDNDNYKKIQLKDLEQSILSPARSTCKLLWKMTTNIAIPVSLINLISKSKYPSKIKVQKDTNDVLETRRILVKENPEDVTLDKSMESTKKRIIITTDNLTYYKTVSGLNVNFKPNECKKIKNLCSETIIEMLALKPITCDPLYHLKPAHFVTCAALCSPENKVYFKTFVSKCNGRNVMPICKVATSVSFFIGMMIPSEDDGGFYLYKVPFNDKIRDLDERLENFIYNSNKPCPTNFPAVSTFKELMEQCKIKFEPKSLKNPKLAKYLAHMEALALNEELGPLPPDSTVPPTANCQMQQLAKTLTDLLSLKAKESRKRFTLDKTADNKRQKLDVKTVVESGKLDTLTVANLKEILKDIEQPTQGNKSTLIERINNYFKK